MREEIRTETRTYSVFWVTDNKGVDHLHHDHLTAQLMEIRYEQERRECENSSKL